MSELNQEEQQQEEVRENSEQDTLKLGVSRRTFIGAGMTAAAAALVLPRQAQGITELIEGNGAGAGGLGDLMGRTVNITNICKPVAFSSPEFSVPPNQWKFNCDPASRTAPPCAPERLEARKATLTYTGKPVDQADICNDPDPDPACQSAEVRVFYVPDVQSPDGGGCVQSPDGGGSVDHMEVLVGPTIICDRGGIIDFELTNYLPAQGFNKASCHTLHEDNQILGSSDSGCFEEFSMHFHGLHVSPRSSDPDGPGIKFSSDHIFAPLVPYTDQPLGRGADGEDLYYKRRFRLAIPEFHAPGTHWYHTHLHGTTAVQTSNGMAGAIIIPEPDDDRKLGVNHEDDRIWLIQEFVPKIHDQDPNSDSDEEFYFKKTYTGLPANNDRPESTVKFESPGRFLVNGQYVPTLNISAGCRQRWRFINATGTPRGSMQLKLYKLRSGCCDSIGTDSLLDDLHSELRSTPEIGGQLVGNQEAMYLIAVDGISFYGHKAQKVGPIGNLDPNYDDYREGWKLAPGNRADFLVNLAAGRYCLLKDSYDKQGETTGKKEKFQVKSDRRQVLGFINVTENIDCTSTDSEDLSEFLIVGTLPNYLQPICNNELEDSPEDGVGSCNKPRIIDFAVRQLTQPQEPTDKRVGLYQINRKQFKDVPNEVAPIKVGLNTAERWLLRNIKCEDGYQGKSAPHPFHIHVNPFQVEGERIDPGIDDGPSNWRWRDVLAVDFENAPERMCAGPDTDLGEFGEKANDSENGYAQKEYDNHTKYKMIRNRFADFDGEYVVHCHILIHEDQGMMRKLIVGEVGDNGVFTVEPAVEPGVVLTEGQENTYPTCPTENGNCLES